MHGPHDERELSGPPRIPPPPGDNSICEHGVFRNLCGQPHDDHSASRNLETLQRDAPHLLDDDDDGEGLVADVARAINQRRQNGDLLSEREVGDALRAAGVKPLARQELERILELADKLNGDPLTQGARDDVAEIRRRVRGLLT